MKKIIFALAISLFLLISPLMAEAAEHKIQAAPLTPSLMNSLRQGGYILYVRHGEATAGDDKPEIVFSDCSTQRNLSDVGRMQAVIYGKALRQLLIPIQFPITASPFCRTKETGELAFGEENVQIDDFWVHIYHLSGDLTIAEQESVLTALTSVLEIKPPAGRNKVIIDHSFPSGVGLGEIPNMGTVLVRPRGQGNGYEVVDKISLAEFMSYLD